MMGGMNGPPMEAEIKKKTGSWLGSLFGKSKQPSPPKAAAPVRGLGAKRKAAPAQIQQKQAKPKLQERFKKHN